MGRQDQTKLGRGVKWEDGVIQKSNSISTRYNNFEMQKELKNGNFIHKLDKLLSNSAYQEIISWDPSKTYIDILDPQLMQTEITPKFFRHSKFESFVRQLNLYGFRKIKGQGRLRFTHSILLNGQPLLSVSNYKCSKVQRNTRERNSSSEQEQQRPAEEVIPKIPQISISNKEEEGVVSGNRAGGELGAEQKALREILDSRMNSALVIQNQYAYWCNMMSMMCGGQPFPPAFNYSSMGPFQPQ